MGKCVKFVVFDLTYCLFLSVSVVRIKVLPEDGAEVSKRVQWYHEVSYKYF